MKQLRVIIAGGGTGGHIFPAIAIAQALERLSPGCALQFAGARGRMEMEKIPQAGYAIEALDIAGFQRGKILANLLLPYKIWKSRRQASALLRSFAPDIVVGVGGYASYPMLSAAQSKKIPTVIQEQNSYAGKSNKLLGRRAQSVCVAYSHMERFFPNDKIVLTGNPVRRLITEMNPDRHAACLHFSLDPDRRVMLVVGGSLGARSINHAIRDLLPQLQSLGLQLIWQTGKDYAETAREAAAQYGHVRVFEFIKEMDLAYAAADFAVSRAGAMAIAELTVAAKPVVFVPYPHAAEDHQTSNAKSLTDREAALMVADGALDTGLMPAIKRLAEDETLRRSMERQLKTLAIADADQRIARTVIEQAV